MGIKMRAKIILGFCAAGFVAGLLLAIIGGAMVHSADIGNWRTDPVHGPGMAMLVIGILMVLTAAMTVAGMILNGLLRHVQDERRRYQDWKGQLTPQERAAVEMGEVAAVWVGAGVLHHHMHTSHKATSQRLGLQATQGVWSQDSNGIWHRNSY
jgi:hypothetical protein